MNDAVPDSAQELEALLQFMYLAPVGLMQTRTDGEVVMMNPRCSQWLMPLAPDGVLDNLFTALAPLAPDLARRVQAHTEPSGAVCEALQLPVRAGRAGAAPAQVLSLTLIRLDAERLMAVIDDITESLRRERALRQSQAWLHSVVRGTQDYAVLPLDAEGRIQGWNATIERLVGNRRAEVEGRPYAALWAGEDRERRAAESLREADSAGWAFDESWMQHADGSTLWVGSLVSPLFPPGSVDAPRSGYNVVVHDMSGRRETLDALRRAVLQDDLTGLTNRRSFFEAGVGEVERCARLGLPLALLMFDADHFKAINDTHGHAAGDGVLRHLADTLSASFREGDTIARLGGEEFAVLLPGTSAAEAHMAAERVCAALRERRARIGPLEIPCTVSVGLAHGVGAGDDLDGLLMRADAALYAAKAAGRDRVIAWQPGLAVGLSPAATAQAMP